MKVHKLIEKTLIGFDYGTRSIGVAVGQTITKTAQPLAAIHTSDQNKLLNKINELIELWRPDALVVGNPINIDGTEQKLTHLTKKFAARLTQQFNLPVHLMDERLTTLEAREDLFALGGYKSLTKSQVDSYSAKLILESWMRQG